jgi:putative transposase
VIDKLRRYYLIIEQIHVDFKVFKMRKKAYSIKRNKIETRIKNLVKDMHWKTAKFLCENYDEIHLGKINTLSIISNETSNIDNTTKRVLLSLSHSKFRERLKHQAKKADSNVRLINEHMTTKTCHSCGKIKEVGSSKTYKCECKVEIGRDINAAINIYKKVEYIVEEDSDDDKED